MAGSTDDRGNILTASGIDSAEGRLREDDWCTRHWIGSSEDNRQSVESSLRGGKVTWIEHGGEAHLDEVFVALEDKGNHGGAAGSQVVKSESDVTGGRG
jgi:hypothetical protein